jgi:hypothetical protein
MTNRTDAGAAQTDGVTIVVGSQGLQPGDEIVGIQRHGESDEVRRLRDRIVEIGVGEHPTGGECVQLKPVLRGHDLNYWNGIDYFDDSLLHIVRRSN